MCELHTRNTFPLVSLFLVTSHIRSPEENKSAKRRTSQFKPRKFLLIEFNDLGAAINRRRGPRKGCFRRASLPPPPINSSHVKIGTAKRPDINSADPLCIKRRSVLCALCSKVIIACDVIHPVSRVCGGIKREARPSVRVRAPARACACAIAYDIRP